MKQQNEMSARALTMEEMEPYIQEVAPSAVSIAVATDAMICTIHLKVSFFVIRF